jgi:hypothetical protein
MLELLYEKIDKMAKGCRMIQGLDPEPSYTSTQEAHPMVLAEEAATYFSIEIPYPDKTGEKYADEIEAFIRSCTKHPMVKDYLQLDTQGVKLRIDVDNIFKWNEKRVYIRDNMLVKGMYEDGFGVRIRAWGDCVDTVAKWEV